MKVSAAEVRTKLGLSEPAKEADLLGVSITTALKHQQQTAHRAVPVQTGLSTEVNWMILRF
ncbi:hypothetical protein [Candidatus Hamiltonella defensa]|uniref:hypothetical protein n=1 Tax=Candidatus Williamhamiltonella defendens TaxID=138072 RepID=UPI0011D04B3B|nr:hypothetical protein [Candidatus Hamiltonella defensa]